MNKVYVCACTALVLSRRRGLPFYKSHGKSVPVAIMPSVMRKGAPGGEGGEEEEEEEDQKGRRREHARKVSSNRYRGSERAILDRPRLPVGG